MAALAERVDGWMLHEQHRSGVRCRDVRRVRAVRPCRLGVYSGLPAAALRLFGPRLFGPRLFRPRLLCPGLFRPGQLCPGQLRPAPFAGQEGIEELLLQLPARLVVHDAKVAAGDTVCPAALHARASFALRQASSALYDERTSGALAQ